jgi:hypothetical protein
VVIIFGAIRLIWWLILKQSPHHLRPFFLRRVKRKTNLAQVSPSIGLPKRLLREVHRRVTFMAKFAKDTHMPLKKESPAKTPHNISRTQPGLDCVFSGHDCDGQPPAEIAGSDDPPIAGLVLLVG